MKCLSLHVVIIMTFLNYEVFIAFYGFLPTSRDRRTFHFALVIWLSLLNTEFISELIYSNLHRP